MNPSNERSVSKVLIVEDDAATSSILNIWLRNKCHVFQANDGVVALQIIDELMKQDQEIDLFIFDISLPHPWTGITLKAEILSRWKIYRFKPFIAESAFAMPHDQEKIFKAGFIEFLAKPFDRMLLVSTVEKYLKS